MFFLPCLMWDSNLWSESRIKPRHLTSDLTQGVNFPTLLNGIFLRVFLPAREISFIFAHLCIYFFAGEKKQNRCGDGVAAANFGLALVWHFCIAFHWFHRVTSCCEQSTVPCKTLLLIFILMTCTARQDCEAHLCFILIQFWGGIIFVN